VLGRGLQTALHKSETCVVVIMYSTKLVDGDEMMDRDDDGETSYKYNTFVDDDDDVAFEPTYLQALPTAAGRNVATIILQLVYLQYVFILI